MAKENIKSNKKFTLTVTALVVALLFAIGGIIGVWAASNQTVSSSFSVSYSIGDNVAVAIGAKYGKQNNQSFTPEWFTVAESQKNEKGLYVIDAPIPVDVKANLQGGNYSTDATELAYVCFYFENLSDEVSLQGVFTNGAIENPETRNIHYMYFGSVVDSVEKTPLDMIAQTQEDPLFTLNEDNQYSFVIPPQTIYCIQMRVEPNDPNQSAKYMSNENGSVGFSFVTYQED